MQKKKKKKDDKSEKNQLISISICLHFFITVNTVLTKIVPSYSLCQMSVSQI